MNAHDQIVKELKDILPGTWEYESDSPHLKGTTFGQGRSKERQVYPGICMRWDKIHADGILFTHPSNASSLEITYCAQGRVGWDMHQRSIYLGQGDLAIHPMDCCSESKMNFPSGYYKGITVEFDFEQMENHLVAHFKELGIDLLMIQDRYCRHEVYAIEQNEMIHDIFYLLEKEGPENQVLQKVKIFELLMVLSQTDWTKEKKVDPLEEEQMEIIQKMHDFLIQHYHQRHTIEELARRFLINTSSLKAGFKAVYGMPIAAYMKEYRMHQASEMLRQTDKPVALIAQEVGYTSQSKFSQAFKDVMHVLPNVYRKEYRKNQKEG